MGQDFEIHQFCGKCQGTGTVSSEYGGSGQCQMCAGDGKYTFGYCDLTDIVDKCNDILDKCNDILDQLSGG